MGGDHAPGEIVAGALQAVDELGVDVLLVGHADAIASRCCRRACPDGVESSRAPRGRSRWTTTRRRRCARRRTRRSSVRAEAVATAGPTPWSAPATPARRWRPRCCASAASGACPARDRGADPGAVRPRRTAAGRRRRDGRLPTRSGSSSGPAGPRVRARAARRRRADGRAALERRGAGQGRRRCASRRSRCSTGVKGFVGNVEGRDLMHGERRRDRHRRVHRQRRAQDARGRAAGLAGLVFGVLDRRPRRRRPPRSSLPLLLEAAADCSIPTTPAARCCSASTACA